MPERAGVFEVLEWAWPQALPQSDRGSRRFQSPTTSTFLRAPVPRSGARVPPTAPSLGGRSSAGPPPSRHKQSLLCFPSGQLSQCSYWARTCSQNPRKAAVILPQADGVIFPSCRTIVVRSMVANLSTRTTEGSRNPARCHCITVTSKLVRATWLVIGATSRSASTES